MCASPAFLLLCLLLFLLQGSDGLVSKWYFQGCTIFCNLSSVNFFFLNQQFIIQGVTETLDFSELLMEDQAWLDYLWDFETRGIDLDLSSDTD